nr:hypothetical protein [uncultured Olsenella sp.]
MALYENPSDAARELLGASDELCAALEFLKDPLAPQLSDEEERACVRDALEAGHVAARQWAGKDLLGTLAEHGFLLRQMEAGVVDITTRNRMQARLVCQQDGGTLDLFMPQLRHKSEVLTALCGDDMPKDTLSWLIDLHVAHEFFHFLEHREERSVSMRMRPVRIRSLLRVRNRRLSSPSEVAAHTFAYDMAGGPVRPTASDYLVLLADGAMTGTEVVELVASARRFVKGGSHERAERRC